MTTRREALKRLTALGAGAVVGFIQLASGVGSVLGGVKRRVLPKGTPLHTLIGKNPAVLDSRNLEITPLDQFETMGLSNFSIAAHIWRLEVTGAVERPLSLSYAELIKLPAIERNVLLICPGFFAHHGRWRGFSVKAVLTAAKLKPAARRVAFSGPKGPREKTERFSLEEILTDRVFLAYRVNGRDLPQKHGYPMRLVAEDHYGARWVKYVDRITLVE